MKSHITVALLFFCLGMTSSFSCADKVAESVRSPLEIKWDTKGLEREKPLPSSFSRIARQALPMVVRLEIERKDEWLEKREKKIPTLFLDPKEEEIPKRRSFGSGVIIDEAGIILTNTHLVAGVKSCQVHFEGVEGGVKGTVVATDEESDLALVQVQTDRLLTAATFTSERALVGDFVLALGNPEGVGMTLSKGIVSAVGRSRQWQRNAAKGHFLQIEATILPGNSGGALLDLEGRLIGINSWYLPKGYGKIGFAYPSVRAAKIAQDLWQFGHVRYGHLGVRLGLLDVERRKELGLAEKVQGVVVLSVEMDLAADRGGLRAGDVITKLDDYDVRDIFGFASELQLKKVGSLVSLFINRGGIPRTLTTTLGSRPIPKALKK